MPAEGALRTVLLIEDDEADEVIARRALKVEWPTANIVASSDGAHALSLLFPESGDPPHYDLIMMDLRLPKIDGKQLLKQIRASDRFVTTPVVVLTGSTDPKEVSACYRLGANSVIQKATDHQQHLHALKGALSYWLGINIRLY
jgi:two-component system, response regulator